MMTNDDTLYLIARIAGERLALPTAAIESVVEVDALTPVPRAAPHIAGLAALRSRVLTIVDAAIAIGLPAGPDAGLRPAVVVAVDGHCFGLLVDEVEDVIATAAPPLPPPPGLSRRWSAVATGLIEHDGTALLLVDPSALIAGPTTLAA